MHQLVNCSVSFLFYTRPETLEEAQFARGRDAVYADNEMAKFDAATEKQLVFIFLQRCALAKKLAAARRASRSATLDLDHDDAAFGVSITDFREISWYLMEDMV